MEDKTLKLIFSKTKSRTKKLFFSRRITLDRIIKIHIGIETIADIDIVQYGQVSIDILTSLIFLSIIDIKFHL